MIVLLLVFSVSWFSFFFLLFCGKYSTDFCFRDLQSTTDCPSVTSYGYIVSSRTSFARRSRELLQSEVMNDYSTCFESSQDSQRCQKGSFILVQLFHDWILANAWRLFCNDKKRSLAPRQPFLSAQSSCNFLAFSSFYFFPFLK